MTQTIVEFVSRRGQEIEALVEQLLGTHSEILEPDPIPGVVLVVGNFWGPLNLEGKRLQAKILRLLDKYEPLVKALTRGAPESAVREVSDAAGRIRDAVHQSSVAWASSPASVLEGVRKAFANERAVLDGLYDPTPGVHVYVPDANAIVANPALEDWLFDESLQFSIVLTPTLLSELDDLKMRSRSDSVREKAESAIRRINEYARRGDIHEGVPLKRGQSTVRMIAVEPRFESTLPWLDASVKDDRLIASVIEIMREHPHSLVTLVTRDVNVLNKARNADVPYVNPPEPPARELDEPEPRKPPSDVRVHDIRFTGGAVGGVNFVAEVQFLGEKPTRAQFVARIGDIRLQLQPVVQDMLVNHVPYPVFVVVPRPFLGDLVPAFASEPTLYGRELIFEVMVEGEVVASQSWRESVYDAETNRERYEIQQQIWRDRPDLPA